MHLLPPSVSRALLLLGFGAALMSSSACRRNKPTTAAAPPPEEIAPALLSNQLSGSPSSLLANQASSPVRWQPFTRLTFQHAEKANRMVLLFVATPQQPDYLRTLREIQRHPVLVTALNEQFVPVLVDADACRESALLTSVLCAESGRPLSLPFLLWLSPKANPVHWIPVRSSDKDIANLIASTNSMMVQLWRNESGFATEIGTEENRVRRLRLSDFAKGSGDPSGPDKTTTDALRSLVSMYDPGSRSLDGCGALFPSGTLELIASARLIPGLPADLDSRCLDMMRQLTGDLSGSAMIDPLEGCIFSSRLGSGWSLPRFNLDCPGQARSIVALLTAFRAGGDPLLLKQSLDAIAFSERRFGTQGGLFALGTASEFQNEDWLWSLEELEKSLTPDELKVVTAVCDLKGLGNIPVESDPTRECFRRNSLALRLPPEKAASRLGIPAASAIEWFDSARKKLLKIRQERLGSPNNDPRPHAASTFRMASAYAAAYATTGDPQWRTKASTTLAKAREAFCHGPELVNFPGPSDETTSGRAFLYALAIQATLDVHDITLDPDLTSWAEDLASTSAEKFIDGDSLRETSSGQSVLDLPVADRSMLFDDSTAGLLSGAQARLVLRGRHTPASFSVSVCTLPAKSTERPILFTDHIQAALIRLKGPIVLVPRDTPQELKDAVCRLPLRVIARRTATEADAVPAASVKIVFQDGRSVAASSSAALQTALGPAPARR